MSVSLLMDSCLPSKIGEEQSAEDAEDGPPELLVSPSYKEQQTCDETERPSSRRASPH